MYQKLLIAGNLGKDPEMRYTANGTPVTSFSIASNRRYTNSAGELVEETIWFRISTWNRLAEICAEYLKKGAKVLVEGRLQPDPSTGGPRIWTDQNGAPRTSFEITASTVQFLSNKQSDNGMSQGEYESETEAAEIPF
jgi:single-strand DNA-binding protein